MKLVCVYDPLATTTTLSGAVTTILPTSVYDPTMSVDGFPVFTSIVFTATHGAFTGGGVIKGSSINTTANGVPIVLMEDKVTITLTNPDSGATEPATIVVSNCNQTSTFAD